jgi:hypothetical protein
MPGVELQLFHLAPPFVLQHSDEYVDSHTPQQAIESQDSFSPSRGGSLTCESMVNRVLRHRPATTERTAAPSTLFHDAQVALR